MGRGNDPTTIKQQHHAKASGCPRDRRAYEKRTSGTTSGQGVRGRLKTLASALKR